MKVYADFGGAMDCITAAITYAVTKSDDVLDVYGIEQQIKQISESIDEIIVLRERTQGDKQRFDDEIKKKSQQLVALRQQRDLAKEKMEAMPKTMFEIERLKAMFEEKTNFLEYHDDVVRCVVDCIRVGEDNKITIILKGGYTVEESV